MWIRKHNVLVFFNVSQILLLEVILSSNIVILLVFENTQVVIIYSMFTKPSFIITLFLLVVRSRMTNILKIQFGQILSNMII